MPKISDEKRQARRDQILTAALACFEKHGLHGATMDLIIAECGLSAGAVYNYYPGKSALIAAALGQALEGWSAALAPVLTSEPPVPLGRLLARVVEVAGALEANGGRGRLLEIMAWGEAQRDEAVRARLRAHYGALTQNFARAIDRARGATQLFPTPEGERDAEALLLVAMGALARGAVFGPADDSGLATALAALAQ